MPKYDIMITLFTIVYGLMLTDLFLSFHKLIKSRKRVKWHWLPILTAWYLFLTILKNWWDLSSFQNSTNSMNIFFFIAYGHLLFLLFLLVSTALPDVIKGKGIELKIYYFQNHRYFWGLMCAVVVLSTSIGLIKRLHQVGTLNFKGSLLVIPSIMLTMTLAISKRYWVHSIIVPIFVIGVILEIIGK